MWGPRLPGEALAQADSPAAAGLPLRVRRRRRLRDGVDEPSPDCAFWPDWPDFCPDFCPDRDESPRPRLPPERGLEELSTLIVPSGTIRPFVPGVMPWSWKKCSELE